MERKLPTPQKSRRLAGAQPLPESANDFDDVLVFDPYDLRIWIAPGRQHTHLDSIVPYIVDEIYPLDGDQVHEIAKRNVYDNWSENLEDLNPEEQQEELMMAQQMLYDNNRFIHGLYDTTTQSGVIYTNPHDPNDLENQLPKLEAAARNSGIPVKIWGSLGFGGQVSFDEGKAPYVPVTRPLMKMWDPELAPGVKQTNLKWSFTRESIMMGLTPQEFYDKYNKILNQGDLYTFDAKKAYEMLSRPDLPETHKFPDLIDLAYKRSQGKPSPTEEISPEKAMRQAQGYAIDKAYNDVAKVIYFSHPEDRPEDEVERILKNPYGEPNGYFTYQDMNRKVFGDYRIRDSEKTAPLKDASPEEIYQATLQNIMAYGLKPLGVDPSIFEGLDFNVEADPSSQMRKQRHKDTLDKWPIVSNILDPIHDTLDQRVFNGIEPRMEFFDDHLHHCRETFRQNGFDPHAFEFYLTGSICTYQYADNSDCDITIVCRYEEFPDIDRADLVQIVVRSLDGGHFPGTPYPFQHFVQPEGVMIADLFPIGLRSAYDLQLRDWISPPDKSREVDIQKEHPDWFQEAIQWSEKMNILIDGGHYEDAFDVYKQLHVKRQEDMQAGLGDISPGNVFYKFVINNGTIDRLRNVGYHIAT